MGDCILRHQSQFFFSSLIILVHVGIPVVCENMALAALAVHFLSQFAGIASSCVVLRTTPAIPRIIQVGIRRNLYRATGSSISLVAAFTFPANAIRGIVSKIGMFGDFNGDTLFVVWSIAPAAFPAGSIGVFGQVTKLWYFDSSTGIGSRLISSLTFPARL